MQLPTAIPLPNLCSCAVYYGSVGPVDPAPATPVTIKAGTCQLSTDVSNGMFSVFASRGDKVPFTAGIVRRPAPEPWVPPDAKNDTPPSSSLSEPCALVLHGWLSAFSCVHMHISPSTKPLPTHGVRLRPTLLPAVSFVPVVDDDCLLSCKKAGLVAVDFGDSAQQICAVALDGRDWWGECLTGRWPQQRSRCTR